MRFTAIERAIRQFAIIIYVAQRMPFLPKRTTELLGDGGEGTRLFNRSTGVFEDARRQFTAAKRHDESGKVGDRLMNGQALGLSRVVEIGRNAVDDGMRRLVRDDVLRMASVDRLRLARRREKEQLETARISFIKR